MKAKKHTATDPALVDLRFERALGDVALAEEARVILRRLLGDLIMCADLPGGVVHKVVRLTGARASVVMKHRGDRCYRLPELPLNPHDVCYEAAALDVLSASVPGVSPGLLCFDRESSTLLISDLATPGLTDGLEFFRQARQELVQRTTVAVAANLAQIHKRVRSALPLRPDGDGAFLRKNLYERIGYHNVPESLELVNAMMALPRQLILGDFGPKNMLVGDNQFRCFDLEHAHFGPRLFDIGFLLGHIALHSIRFGGPAAAAQCANSGFEAYQHVYPLDSGSVDLLWAMVAATIAYRCNNQFVPYAVGLRPDQVDCLGAEAITLLGRRDGPLAGAAVCADLLRRAM